MAFADDVVRAQLLVAFVFLACRLEVDLRLGELVAGADAPGGEGGDPGALADGGAFREAAQADNAFAPGDDSHLVTGCGEDLSAGADDLAEGAGGDGLDDDAEFLLAFGADLDVSVGVGGGFFGLVFVLALVRATGVQDGTQGHQDSEKTLHRGFR